MTPQAAVHSRPVTAPFLPDAATAPAGLEGRRVDIHVRGPVVDPALAWSLLGDTDWLNRVGGNGAVLSMDMAAHADGLAVLEGTLAGPLGMRLPFQEAWTSWSRGKWFRQVRTVRSPLLNGTDYHARLVPEAGGVRPEITLGLHLASWASPVARAQLSSVGRRWEAALNEIGGAPGPLRTLPDAARASLDRWAATDAEVVQRFATWLTTARPTQLTRIRPFVLADQWGMNRDRVLDTFVSGVAAGAVELFWSVRCVRCYAPVGGAATLSDLPDHLDCPSCRVRTGVDLGESVEVLFLPHPSVIPRRDERFCTFYPASAPEQYAVYTLAPGQTLADDIVLPAGSYRLGAAGNAADQHLLAAPGGPTTLRWRASEGPSFAVDAPVSPAAVGPVRLELENDSEGRRRVYLTRTGGEDPVVLASLLSTRPSWRRAYSHEVLSPDLRLSVRSVTILFTDLSGSTAMYEELGDARAFAVVRDHFVILRKAIEGEQGSIIKTIGDAVMAAFHEPERATRAAIAMQAAFAPWAASLGLTRPLELKVGLHTGAALAVQGDLGLDWFGHAVNLAARTQGAAHGGETLLTGPTLELPEVQIVLAESGFGVDPVDVELKGIAGTTRLWRLRPQ